MTQPLYRLADSTLVEPLVQNWPAWWLTVAPLPAALHTRQYQLPVLKSYLQNPTVHLNATKGLAFSGSAFAAIPQEQQGQARELLQRTESQQADGLKLAEAFEALQTLLLTEAKGQSLEPFYARVPEPLRGFVELVYDYHHRPSARLLERALYRSRHYKPELQSLRLSRLGSDAERPFFLSTPRLEDARSLSWRVPFADARVDRLFALDLEPRPLEEIRALLGLTAESDDVLRSLLTEAPAAPRATWSGPTVRIRYLGHASVLLEWKGVSLLVDPLVGPRPTSGGMERTSFAELPARIDYVLITHAHADHFCLETLLRLRQRIGRLVVPRSSGALVGDASLRTMALRLGFRDVVEVDAYESLPLEDGEITAVPFLGEHGDLAHSKSAYVVRTGASRVLFAADSACLEERMYRDLRETLGPIDTVFTNTEIEGSPLTFSIEALFPRTRDRRVEKDRRCRGSNVAEGLLLLECVGAKRLYNYAMGLEPWLAYVLGPAVSEDTPRMRQADTLLEKARALGLSAERLFGTREFHIDP
jgi:L-ascorbate metabolism protein UlaG (beta-lactamase superfamily)